MVSEPDRQGEDDKQANRPTEDQGPAHIELVRVIDRTLHVSPLDREKEVDFTVRNSTDHEFNFIFLPLRQFERNLEAFDEEGTLLNIYPNDVVEEMLKELKEEDPEGYTRFEHRFKQSDYQLLIQLPLDRPLAPGTLRTIRLRFEQSDQVEFFKLSDPSILRGWFGQWKKKFFRIPAFEAEVERYPGHPHDVFVVVVGTPGYATRGSPRLEGSEPSDDIHENGLDDDTRVLSVRLPQADPRRYVWTMNYELVPNSRTLMASLALYWVVATSVGIVLAVFGALDMPGFMLSYGRTLSAGLATASLGLIFALNEEWTERYRLLTLIPLLCNAAAWTLWPAPVAGAV